MTLQMAEPPENSSSGTVKKHFFCKVCKETHEFDIPLDIFNTDSFPVSYGYVHGDPLVVMTVYLDANKKIRSAEYTTDLNLQEDQLNDILNKSKALVMTAIPEELIYGLQLTEGKSIQKIYIKNQFKKLIDFSEIGRIWKASRKMIKSTGLTEFFLKYSDLWVVGMEIMDYKLILVVDATIDIEHLKTQSMALFETILAE